MLTWDGFDFFLNKLLSDSSGISDYHFTLMTTILEDSFFTQRCQSLVSSVSSVPVFYTVYEVMCNAKQLINLHYIFLSSMQDFQSSLYTSMETRLLSVWIVSFCRSISTSDFLFTMINARNNSWSSESHKTRLSISLGAFVLKKLEEKCCFVQTLPLHTCQNKTIISC